MLATSIRTFVLTLALAAGLPASTARAAVIQILHTNDLHAALNTAGAPKDGEPEFGGWGQIKTLLDQYTAEAKAKGIETIRLDAGDFLEGTIQYFPKNGLHILQAYQRMNWDASTLGNHDWLMGARGLDQLLSESPFTSPLISANIKINKRLKHLSQQLQPYTIIEKGGVKIGVFGLATTEAFYKWIPKIRGKASDFKLRDYNDSEGFEDENGDREIIPGIANKTIAELKPKTDAVIALTHIGFEEDLGIVQESRGLDLVVGGHSHTFLETLNVEKDRDGREVPVVQTGYNGRMIGRVMMEVTPGQPAKVLTYELIPVPHETKPDAAVAAAEADANRAVVELYGSERLDEVIGKSEVRLVPGKFGPTAFSKFAVDAIRKSTDADAGIDIGVFQANTPLPGGDITRRKLMEMYPRKFEADQNQGLYVYKAKVLGLVLALGLKFSVKYGVFASFAGLDYKTHRISDTEYARAVKKEKPHQRDILTHYRAKEIKVNGQRICLTCVYEIAAPESLIRGAYGVSFLTRLLIWSGKRSPVTIWQAMESHLRDIKTIRALEGNETFSPRRYANFYQRAFGENLDPEQIHSEETPLTQPLDHTFNPSEQSAEFLLNAFVREVMDVQKSHPKMNKSTDADSLGVD